MKLDSEDQRKFILEIIGAVQVRGDESMDRMYELKQIVKTAGIELPDQTTVKVT